MTYTEANNIKRKLVRAKIHAIIVPVAYVPPGHCIGAIKGRPLTQFGVQIGKELIG